MEGITVLDLTGLSYSAAKVPEAMDILKLAGKVGDYFPVSIYHMECKENKIAMIPFFLTFFISL
jgi:hypothetical protein